MKRARKRARVDGPQELPDVPLFDGSNFNTWLGAIQFYWGKLWAELGVSEISLGLSCLFRL